MAVLFDLEEEKFNTESRASSWPEDKTGQELLSSPASVSPREMLPADWLDEDEDMRDDVVSATESARRAWEVDL